MVSGATAEFLESDLPQRIRRQFLRRPRTGDIQEEDGGSSGSSSERQQEDSDDNYDITHPTHAEHQYRPHQSWPTSELRVWKRSELQIVLALICQGVHKEGVMEFSTQLNKALNDDKARNRYEDDIEIYDVEELLLYFKSEHKDLL